MAKLGDHAKKLLFCGDMSDIQFAVGRDYDTVKIFPAQKVIMGLRSAVFHTMFYGNLPDPCAAPIDIPDILPEAFANLLSYIYTDAVTNFTPENVFQTLMCADKYDLPLLLALCTDFILGLLNVDNCLHNLDNAVLYANAAPDVLVKCLCLINDESAKTLWQSDQFHVVGQAALQAFDPRDALTAAADDIFSSVEKWVEFLRKVRDGITFPTVTTPEAQVTIRFSGDKKALTSDTTRFRFELPSNVHVSGVPVGKFVKMTVTVDGRSETQCYTPISDPKDRGFVDFAIKVYPPNAANPNGSVVSQCINKLQKGDEVCISGPYGLLSYDKNGIFVIKANEKSAAEYKEIRRIGMVAAGSGVTAMIPILRAMLKENLEAPKCSLVYSNPTDQDIIMKSELNYMASKYRKRFKLWYLVDRLCNPSLWKYGVGQISKDWLKDWMPKPDNEVVVLVCGPKEMVDNCKKLLLGLNYINDMIHVFSAP
ncbi:NADH-cytochrome b5 reductase 3-like [Paramacrobiotus metropolitanus]|uniref:NADH-cytochrome b5 reductase 3-like n=1 Tax=Paramacrobiotus metropolitanus TaxID=2943436 RepID=UPI00244605A7|nr:NADH-cytochrome b5 reductase 3-like [Paramacrobiotus metropolitanus]